MLCIYNPSGPTKKVLNILAIGAHPDDCDSKFGGTAALFAQMGHKVKFLALTNGDAGHYAMGGGVLAKNVDKRRKMQPKHWESPNMKYWTIMMENSSLP